jgi:hypothetical protein
MGIEPTLPAWKAGTLPLSYTRDWLLGTILGRPPLSMVLALLKCEQRMG